MSPDSHMKIVFTIQILFCLLPSLERSSQQQQNFFVYSAKALLDAFHASRTLHALQCSVWRLKLSSQTYSLYLLDTMSSLQNRYNSHWPMNTIHLYDPMIYIHITDPDQRSWSDPLVCTAIFIKKKLKKVHGHLFSRGSSF